MQKIYTIQSHTATKADTQQMKTPRATTLNFLRNFARAYTFTAQTGTIILN